LEVSADYVEKNGMDFDATMIRESVDIIRSELEENE